jgi:ribosomal protein L37AE/L43A
MAIRTATMSSSYLSSTRHSGFLGKLIFTLLFVASIAGSMALFDTYQKNLSLFWMAVLAVLSVGLASGVASRIAFYKWSGFTRFLVTLFVLPIGLFVLGVLTSWQIGIGPLNPWVRGIIPQDELIQLGGSLLVALVCLEAWWKPLPQTDDLPVIRSSPKRKKRTQTASSIQNVQPRPAQIHTQENLTFLPKRNPHPPVIRTNKVGSRAKPVVDKLVFKHMEPVHSRRKKTFSHKPMLQISTFEEHRCPFCLEEVKRNDPRGIKECEVCHSLHHADCWAITGMCQVPHLNS